MLELEFSFDLANRDMLLVVFFTTVGLSAKVEVLRQGGKALIILLFLATGYLLIQNLAGIGVAVATGQAPLLGLLTGSVSLSGGHGTAIAWAPVFARDHDLTYAFEIGLACATFGLIFGGIAGGPVARYLIWRHKLVPESEEELTIGFRYKEHEIINVDVILKVLLIIALAIGLGLHLNQLCAGWGLILPDFVACLFAGIILTNTIPVSCPDTSGRQDPGLWHWFPILAWACSYPCR